MKRPAAIRDPLEETMQNPDLPPIAAAPATRAASRPARRGLRVMLLLAAFVVAGVFVALVT